MRRFLILVAVLLIPSAYTLAQEQQNDLSSLVSKLLNAQESEQGQIIDTILSLNPQPEHIENLLKQGVEYSKDARKGWQILTTACSDGKSRPFHVYVPESYDPTKRWSVLINLHGAVSRPTLLSEQMMKGFREMWSPQAKECIQILPLGQGGCEWWSEVGASAILGALRVVQRRCNIDENRVYLSGFSDGGSGVFYIALHHSTPFAAFAPLNGFVGVAEMGGEEVHLPGISNKPLYVVNCGRDRLYPADQMTQFIDEMKKAGAKVTYKVYETAGHDFSYGETEKPLIMDFFNKNPRNPFPAKLTIETANVAFGRVHYIRIDKIEDVGNNWDFPDYNVMFASQRAVIGVVLDQNFEGLGARLQEVAEGSLAAKLGLAPGDVIIKLGGKDVDDADTVRTIMASVKLGEEVTMCVKRGDKLLPVKGLLEKPQPKPAFSREKISGRIDASVSGNRVETKVKNVGAYTLFVSRDQFNVNEEVEVYTNGELSFRGKVKPDLAFILSQYLKDRDRAMVFWGKVEIRVEKKTKEK
jgi:membrane-associated protease RseP (regulator of RpoE activity)